MRDVVVVEAVRSPVGRRKGGLSAMHSADLLGEVQRAVVERSGIDPAEIEQVVGGCVGQVGHAGRQRHPHRVAAGRAPARGRRHHGRTRSAARRSRPPTWPPRSIAAGVVDVAVACGVEVMSVVPMGSTVPKDPFVGKPINRKYWEHYENTSQFEGAERIAEKFGVTRDELDAFGKQSQDRAAVAWAEGRFDTQVVPIEAPTLDENGEPNGTHTVTRDEGLRDTTLEALANLKPVLDRDPAFHTAGTASQISDGAGALLLMTAEKADAPRPAAAGADRRHVHRRQRPGAHAHRARSPPPSTCSSATSSPSTTSTWSRSTRRSPRWCSAGSRPPAPTWRRSTRTAAPSRSVTRSAAPAPSCSPRPCTSSSVPASRRALVTMCCGGGLGTGTILERI